MKKLFLLFFIIPFIYSCENETSEIPNIREDTPQGEITVKSAGDGDKDLLGFGYDLLYALADNYKGARNPVINIDAFVNNRPLNPLTGEPYTGFLPKGKIEVAKLHGNASEYETFGYNLEDFYRNTALKLTTNSGSLIPFGKIQFTAEFDNTITNKETYSFYKKDICRNVKRMYFSTFSTSRLKYYLSEEFIFAINNYTAAEILQDFGTHILVDIYVGGKLSALVSAKSSSSSSTEVQNFTANFFDMIKTTAKDSVKVSKQLENVTLTMVQHGGKKVETVNVKLSSGGAIDRSVFDWNEWVNSVDESSSYLIYSDPNTLIPIYEFIYDPVLKQQVIDLIIERSKQEPTKPYEPEDLDTKAPFSGVLFWGGQGGSLKINISGEAPVNMRAGSTIKIYFNSDKDIANYPGVKVSFGSASIDRKAKVITYSCATDQTGTANFEIISGNNMQSPKFSINVLPLK
jgi:hypothetical protein